MHQERECTHVPKHVMCKYIIVYILCVCLSVHIMSLSSWLRWMAAELKLPLQSLCVERLFGTTRLPFVSGRPVDPKLCAEPSRPGRAATDIPSLVRNSKHPRGYQEATESISHNLFHEKREKENKYLLSLHVLIFHHSFIFSSKGQRCPLIVQLYKVVYVNRAAKVGCGRPDWWVSGFKTVTAWCNHESGAWLQFGHIAKNRIQYDMIGNSNDIWYNIFKTW